MGVVLSPSARKGRGNLDAQIKFILAIKMKVLIALCFLLSSVLAKPQPEAEAKPWDHPKRFGKSLGHHHPYGPGPYAYGYHALPARLIQPVAKCHTVYDTTYTTKCKNVPERICKAVPVTKYRTDYKSECHAVPE